MVLSCCRLLLPKKKSTSVSATIPSLLTMGESYIRNVASLLELLVVYRFAEVAELIRVCRLEIIAKINTCLLSPATLYTVYLVFKFASTIYGLENQPVDVYGLDNQPVDATMKLDGGEYGAQTVSWNAQGMHRCNSSVTVRGRVHYPEERGDGWLEMELGDFFSTEKEDGELEIRSGELHLNELPEGCIANVLSFTAPLDVARLSAVSPMFKSAAISDVVWERFLPSDLESVLSTSPDGSLLLASVSSKRELYFSLCDNPILVDNGRKTAVNNGTRLSHWRDENEILYGTGEEVVLPVVLQSHVPSSMFPEVAELIKVSWLEIRGKFNTSMLSPSILYTANLVFKFSISAYGLVDQPVEVAMKLDGDKICEHSVSWNAERRPVDFFIYSCRRSIPARESDGHYPKKRGDGWLEIELGDFLCTEGEDGELEMRVFDGINYWKHGLIVEGIEIRPKEVGASPSS
ncbi:hypothetical protein POTOM_055697 [Populus tomentosa]|uniref:F-box domain-containing protein n=1 Tax=Populus tomentosa TaxID=118781 RepID=A0A8X8C3V3_POPTO|nr:hypothetical protein POTOM_055697 [Populus tomentosa]